MKKNNNQISCNCASSKKQALPQHSKTSDAKPLPDFYFTIINESPSELIWFLPEKTDQYLLIPPKGSLDVAIPENGLTSLPPIFVAHLHKGIIKDGCLMPHHKLVMQMKDKEGKPITITHKYTLTFFRLLNYGEGGCRISLIDTSGEEIPILTDINPFK